MFYKFKDLQIYYQIAGSGKDLILLHGWGQDVSTWWGLVDLLKDDFKLWLIDLPGFGRSDNPANPWTVGDYAEVVAEFIKNNKIKKPILLGHSLGGNISIKLASKYPNLISNLILEDSSGIRPKGGIKKTSIFILAKIFHYLVPNIFNLKDKLRTKLYLALEADYINAGNLKGTLVNILNEDLVNKLPGITSETLIIWGENDRSVKLKYGKMMYQLIKNSSLEVIEGVGHFPHLENQKLFTYYVKDFSNN